MTTPIKIGIAVAVLVVGAGVLFVFSQRAVAPTDETSPTPGTPVTTNTERTPPEAPSGSGTLKSLLTLGQNLKCDFSYDDSEAGTHTEGTIYLGSGRMRGDFTMTREGTEFTMSTIHDGDYAYTWGSGPTGTMALKFALNKGDAAASKGPGDNDPLASDNSVDYTCRPWNVDMSILTPPSDIEFQEMPTTQPGVTTGAPTDAKAAQCAACAQAPAEARAQCLAAMGC